MKNLKAAFYTLGCKVNQYETNGMIQEFKKSGYDIVDFDEIADVYIVNTCTVTNMADRKSRQMLRKVKELNPKAILVAVGCYAQVAKEELEKIPEIDLILGTNEKKNVISFVEEMLKAKLDNKPHGENRTIENNLNHSENCKANSKINNDENNKIHNGTNHSENNEICNSTNYNENNKTKRDTNKESEKNATPKQSKVTDVMHCEEYVDFGDVTFTEKTRAVIKVQDGCDRFCSYCIIPFARGRIRSRNPESVVSEITKIAKQGIKEVVITGIHLASYGRDFKSKKTTNYIGSTIDNAEMTNNIENTIESTETKNDADKIKKSSTENNQYGLIDLLEEIDKIEGIERVRLRFIRTNINY